MSPTDGLPRTGKHRDCATMEDVVREVLCRVFDDGADEGLEQWRAWYTPTDWMWWGRGLGAFIRQRLDKTDAGEMRQRLYEYETALRSADRHCHDVAVLLESERAYNARLLTKIMAMNGGAVPA